MAAIEERFLAEAMTMARLRHPHLLSIWDYGEEDGVPFYLMEYFSHNLGQLIGETHRSEIPSRVVRTEKALHYIRQTLRGLERLHDAGIIHRDIKPFNIMITDEDAIKIGDFGTSMLYGERLPAPDNLKIGSPFYAAPEQERAPNDVDFSADTYSVAVMLHRMLRGSLPGDDQTAGRWNPGPRVDWTAFFDRALANDPRRRFVSAASMLAAVEALADDWRLRRERSCRATPVETNRPVPAADGTGQRLRLRSRPDKIGLKTARSSFGLDLLWRPLVIAEMHLENDHEGLCVRDDRAGLLWQRGGAPFPLSWKDSLAYIAQLNDKAFAGCRDWRLPTVPELTRLLSDASSQEDFCAASLFDPHQRWLWSADRCTFTSAWLLDLALGFIGRQEMDAHLHVKAVASLL
jgi:serine/threonine-protein kinase